MRRRYLDNGDKILFTKRFYPAGTYTWTVPDGCYEVDVFLVGGGGSGSNSGGGSGYTKTFRGHDYQTPSSGTWVGTYDEGRDGNAISVTPGQQIQVIVGKGGDKKYQSSSNSNGSNGGYSQFMNSNYRAYGGKGGIANSSGGNGGSAGSAPYSEDGGSDGGNCTSSEVSTSYGQGHTTRDFGEPEGKRNAGGGSGESSSTYFNGGISDYTEGKGEDASYWSGNGHGRGGGGYGGGGGGARGWNVYSGAGGDGTVLIRYYAYEE